MLLHFDAVRLENLFSLPTKSTSDIGRVGQEAEPWLCAREALSAGLDGASAVLLAYGVVPPTGPAGKHHAAQVAWLEAEIAERELPVYWVGGQPRHPSRWQRHTYRAQPGVAFEQALPLVLLPRA